MFPSFLLQSYLSQPTTLPAFSYHKVQRLPLFSKMNQSYEPDTTTLSALISHVTIVIKWISSLISNISFRDTLKRERKSQTEQFKTFDCFRYLLNIITIKAFGIIALNYAVTFLLNHTLVYTHTLSDKLQSDLSRASFKKKSLHIF